MKHENIRNQAQTRARKQSQKNRARPLITLLGVMILCLVALPYCSRGKKDCPAICAEGYKECMDRGTQAERCGFARQNCLLGCK